MTFTEFVLQESLPSGLFPLGQCPRFGSQINNILLNVSTSEGPRRLDRFQIDPLN